MSTTTGLPWKHVCRDVAILLATVGLWRVDGLWRANGGVLPVLIAIVAGAAAAFCAYLIHEWGHFLGARIARGFVRLPESPREIFLFKFDTERNTPRQFTIMSCGGFVASGVVLAAMVIVMPVGALSTKIALGLAFAGVVATAILELPPFWRVLRGGPMPRGAAFVSGTGED